ncbi:TPA: hypothetical protein IEQ23_002357 [Escherichia coli]|nr:hypothetical protein [Escherichia coli]
MKQMSLIEMDGFLKGKCIPSDLKVNETNAEYLVRKFAEAEAKCAPLAFVSTEVSSACGMYRLVTVPDSFLGFCANCKATCPDG